MRFYAKVNKIFTTVENKKLSEKRAKEIVDDILYEVFSEGQVLTKKGVVEAMKEALTSI